MTYDTANGASISDHYGKGGDKCVRFAVVDAHLKVTTDDFTVIHRLDIDVFG